MAFSNKPQSQISIFRGAYSESGRINKSSKTKYETNVTIKEQRPNVIIK